VLSIAALYRLKPNSLYSVDKHYAYVKDIRGIVELRQLRAFLEVSSELHFGRAAARLNLTQPALTQRIQALERELGVRVLERNAREVKLTSAGELLLPYARSLVQLEQSAVRNLKDHAAGSAGRIRIAYLNSGDVEVAGRIVAEFRRRYAAVDVHTSSASTFVNLDRMARGDVDVAFVSIAGPIPPGVEVLWVSRLPLMLAIREGHRLSKLNPVPVSALAGEPFIMFPAEINQSLVAGFESWVARHDGGKLNIVAYEPPDQAIQAVAMSDSLMTLVNGGRAQPKPVPGVIYRSLTPSPLLEFGIAYLRDDPSPIITNLLQIAADLARQEPRDIAADSELVLGGPTD
jgi:DNA-binding transcriptional LysR family regulator